MTRFQQSSPPSVGRYEFEQSQQRFGMYRWHVMDPIRFKADLRVTLQALGWRSESGGQRRYLQRRDDIASTALWYQTEPHAPFPTLPGIKTTSK